MKVAKFGGSSVKDALSMRRCAEIVANDRALGLVIISATHNTTNQLEEISNTLTRDLRLAMDLANSVMQKHLSLARELDLNKGQLELFTREVEVLHSSLNLYKPDNTVSAELKDLILSWGEKVSSFLFFSVLENLIVEDRKVTWLNACDYIATDSMFGLAGVKSQQIEENCKAQIKDRFDNGELFITQGFVGSDGQGRVTTLGREGSDYSAALFAGALQASEVEIWTDVDGIYQCDPNIISEAKKIDYLSYDQATTMAKSGAKVLFGKTLAPLRGQEIPVYVKSSLNANAPGSVISKKAFLERDLISLTAKNRSDGVIITLVGNELDLIEIEQSEIDRGEGFRSFFIPNKSEEEVLSLWYTRYFCS